MLILISGLVKFIFERSLSGKEIQFLSEVVFAVTFGIYLLKPRYILSDNTTYPNMDSKLDHITVGEEEVEINQASVE